MSIRVAIAGVGNCASSLVQGVEYYKDTKDEDKIPGLMHNNFGGYRVRDIEFVTAFDVDALKVGKDLSEAIGASQNNTIKFADVPNLGVEVLLASRSGGKIRYDWVGMVLCFVLVTAALVFFGIAWCLVYHPEAVIHY